MTDEKIKNTIIECLEKMRIAVDGVESVNNKTHTTFLIRSPDARLLIGTHGEHLDALSYLVRRIIEKEHQEEDGERPVFIVDVNNYQTKKIQELIDSVELTVRRVKLFRQDVELSPMTSYERMIIHTSLSEDPEITTESNGEGRFRHVVLKYRSGEYADENNTSHTNASL